MVLAPLATSEYILAAYATRVPITSPRTARAIFPFSIKSKITIGNLFSRHSANAAASATANDFERTSSYVIVSYLVAVESFLGSAL
jgi:hypothetical protein